MKKSELKSLIKEVIEEVELQNELSLKRAVKSPRAAMRALKAGKILQTMFNPGKPVPSPKDILRPLSTKDYEDLESRMNMGASSARDAAIRKSNPLDYDAGDRDPLTKSYEAGGALIHSALINKHQAAMKKILKMSDLKVKFIPDGETEFVEGELSFLDIPKLSNYNAGPDLWIPTPNLFARYPIMLKRGEPYILAVGFTFNTLRLYQLNQKIVVFSTSGEKKVKFASPRDEEKVIKILSAAMPKEGQILGPAGEPKRSDDTTDPLSPNYRDPFSDVGSVRQELGKYFKNLKDKFTRRK